MNNHAQLTFRCPHCERMSCYDAPETVSYRPPTRPIGTDYASVLEEVAERHGMTLAAMLSSKRSSIFFAARSEAAVILRRETDLSLADIGRLLGGRDHSTVIHMLRRWELRHPESAAPPLNSGNGNVGA